MSSPSIRPTCTEETGPSNGNGDMLIAVDPAVVASTSAGCARSDERSVFTR